MIDWQWRRFNQLTPDQLYEIIAVREAVFIVEQNCPYQDADGIDQHAQHLMGWNDGKLAAYCRVVEPGVKYAEPSIGRVLTAAEFRGEGFGRGLMGEAISGVERNLPGRGIRISAQLYLKRFYKDFGFEQVSDTYLEDDIPHIEMLRAGD
ncbi:GNAT family N-acetyltransferase [Proteobacteria bacterium 005FR1]|nr:GNAT family N-acetyltransferase [Proteobacteria bacterium 005FR1]